MVKLNKQVDSLENVIEKIERKIEELSDKMLTLQDIAGEEDRELTSREWDKIWKWEEEISELEDEIIEIENALNYLREYTD